jgi:hypothetical protein
MQLEVLGESIENRSDHFWESNPWLKTSMTSLGNQTHGLFVVLCLNQLQNRISVYDGFNLNQ